MVTQTGGSMPNAFAPLRQEAKVLSDEELTEDQRVAVRQLETILASAVKQAEAQPQRGNPGARNEARQRRPDYLHEADTRYSHVALINGARGSGKTSVLHTVLDYLGREARGDPHLKRAVKLGALKHKNIVPLQVFDLNPLPDKAKLHPWLIQVFAKVVQHCEPDGGADPLDLEPSESGEATTLTQAWRRLLKAVSLGWGGAHEGKLSDPEQFVYSAGRIAEEQSGLGEAWSAFIDRAVRGLGEAPHGSSPSLFVVGIDDMDMRPALLPDLLFLLRALQHPRVLFMCTGDLDLMEFALHGEFFKVISVKGLDRLERPSQYARQLAKNTVAKIIAPTMRVALPTIPPRERWLALQELLGGVRFNSDVHGIHLPRSTPARGAAQRERSLADLLANHPQAWAALPDRPRFIQDLRLRRQQNPEESASELCAHLYSLDLDSSDVPERMRAALRGAVYREQGKHDVSGVGLEPRCVRIAGNNMNTADGGPNLDAAASIEMRLRLPGEGPDEYLPDQVAAAIWLNTSLACAMSTNPFRGTSPVPSPYQMDYVRCRWALPPTQEEVSVHWGVPAFASALEWDRMNEYWKSRSVLARRSGPLVDSEFLLVHFLRSILAGARPDIVPGAARSQNPNGLDSLTMVLDDLKRALPAPVLGPKAPFFGWLLFDMPLLCAPESGLPKETANRLHAGYLQRFEGVPAWPSSKREKLMKEFRALRIVRSTQPDGRERLLQFVDRETNGYDFMRSIAGRAAKRP